ncbi:MAG: PKD domain-containing protein [Paludibacter sp.]|nr:PKD domain-containing protein [Paludibacter sp.]
MKKNIKNILKVALVLVGFGVMSTSCNYDQIKDADYVAAKLYLPAASNGVFAITDVPQRVEFLPTSGQAYRFKIDMVRNKFIIPLSVYRAGFDKTKMITATIAVNTDTINILKAKTTPIIPATTIAIPADKYSVVASVNVASGQQTSDFDLEIDLPYLRSFPDAVIGLGVGITSSDLEVNPLLKMAIITISTKILTPTAIFTSTIDAANKAKVSFKNTSAFGIKYNWDFGDGQTDTLKAPVHFYAASGTYTAKLTVTGVLGDVNKISYTLPTAIVISMKAIPDFIYSVAADNIKKINFENKSLNSVSYTWDFGDSTPVSTEKSPSHVYATAGTYSVKLTAVPDNATPANTVTKTVAIVVK